MRKMSMHQEMSKKRWLKLGKCLLIAAVTLGMLTGFGKGVALADTGSSIHIVSNLSAYSSHVEIAWDVPENLSPAEYVIYVDGSERYRSKTNQFSFSEMAPGISSVVTVRPLDAMGFLYDEIGSVTIKTGYSRKLIVGTTILSEKELSAIGASASYIDIQTAVNEAKPGDVIIVKDGYYTGNIRIQMKHSGTESQWITLKSENDAAWLFGNISLEASFYRIEGMKIYNVREVTGDNDLRLNETGYPILENAGKKYLVFDAKTGKTGISASGSDTQVVHVEVAGATGSGFVLSGKRNYMGFNVFHNTTTGGIINGSNLLFDRNEISGVAAYAFLLPHGDIDVMRAFGFNNTIRNNYVHDLHNENIGTSHVDFIQTYDNNREITRNMLIEGNYVDCFLHQGIWLESGSYPGEYLVSDITIRNNVIKGFNAWAMCGYKTRNIVAENNIFIGNNAIYGTMVRAEGGQASYHNNIYVDVKVPYGSFEGAVLTDSGNNLMYKLQRPFESEVDITADPLFVDEANGDYHIKAGSPAIDNGRITDEMRESMQEDGSMKIRQDAEGNARVSGNGIDIGPYEYQSVSATDGVESLMFEEGEITLGIGDMKKINVIVYPVNAKNQSLIFESSNPKVAAIGANQVVTGISEGTVTITVKNTETKVTASCQVTVRSLPGFRSLRINPDVLSFEQGIDTYAADVSFNTTSAILTPEWVNGKVTINGTIVSESGASVNVPLAVGENTILVTYSSSIGNTDTYRIKLKRAGIMYYDSLTGYGDTQGENQWYYYRLGLVSGEYIELNWSEVKGMWTMADSLYRPLVMSDRQHTEYLDSASVRAWKAPRDGIVTITGAPKIGGRTPYDTGSIITIKKNDKILWTQHLCTNNLEATHSIAIDVKEGDMIYFIQQAHEKVTGHYILWNPVIAFPMISTGAEPLTGDVNSDGVVDVVDLDYIARNIDKTSKSADWQQVKKADINGDGRIDVADLSVAAKLCRR